MVGRWAVWQLSSESRAVRNYIWKHHMSTDKDTEETASTPRTSCPLCDSNRFTWGVTCTLHPLVFKPDEARRLAKLGGQTLKARRCNSCGNIQLFALE